MIGHNAHTLHDLSPGEIPAQVRLILLSHENKSERCLLLNTETRKKWNKKCGGNIVWGNTGSVYWKKRSYFYTVQMFYLCLFLLFLSTLWVWHAKWVPTEVILLCPCTPAQIDGWSTRFRDLLRMTADEFDFLSFAQFTVLRTSHRGVHHMQLITEKNKKKGLKNIWGLTDWENCVAGWCTLYTLGSLAGEFRQNSFWIRQD